MKYTFSADGQSDIYDVTDPGSHFETQAWHAYASGTFGGGTVTIWYSPDGKYVADGSSRWFQSQALQFSAAGDGWFQARFRKLKFILVGSSSPALTIEVV